MTDVLNELNKAWAEAAIKALDGDTSELRLRIQLSGAEMEPLRPSPVNQDNLLSVADLISRFKIAPMTLHRWRIDPRMGFPEEIRVGGRVFFNPQEIDRWWNAKTRSRRYRGKDNDIFVKGLNLAIAIASQLDGAPCCAAENLTAKEKALFNQGQKEATGFVADYLQSTRDRYVKGLSISPAEKLLDRHFKLVENEESGDE